MHYLGYFLKWDPQEMYYYAVENTGFRLTQKEQKEAIQNIQV